ncbi:hypothetical protein GQR58_005760 [Nymphon striatum]|nr:hypothetical protein GQR58_024011 [Nymphon striatum]KAG1698319.1 hypothetical protein GQR58_005760 [Nymphon striatum]
MYGTVLPAFARVVFATSAAYTFSCIDLFGNKGSFSDNHRIVTILLKHLPTHDETEFKDKEEVHKAEGQGTKIDLSETENVDREDTEDIENLDDDFNNILNSITSIEAETREFEIPEHFNIASEI